MTVVQDSQSPVRFEQQRQQVAKQFNAHTMTIVNTVSAAYKLDVQAQQLPYRLDREPQCSALWKHLSERTSTDRPLCVIATGTDHDLPDAFAATMFDFLSRGVLRECGLKDFRPPTRPLCRELPINVRDPEGLWRIVGTIFLGLRALEEPQAAREAFATLPSSIAFGFCVDAVTWSLHATSIQKWIESLSYCSASSGTLVLAVILISGSTSHDVTIRTVHSELSERYQNDPNVLVLPTLGPVTRREFRVWRQTILDDFGSSFLLEELETLALDVFPEALPERRMGEVWDLIIRRIQSAWIKNDS
jgi:hypothetical protein